MKTHAKTWAMFAILIFGMLLASLWLIHPARAAGPWYVAPGGDDGDDCLSSGTPCETINGAIGKATAGDTVFVATGIYTNSTGDEVVLIDKDIALSGGWDPTFAIQDGMSTVDGGGVYRGIMLNSGVAAFIEYFVVQNSFANSSSGIYDGAGIYSNGTLTLDNSMVISNTSEFSWGGGIFNSGMLTVTNSSISENTSLTAGGGLLNSESGIATLTNITVEGNFLCGITSFGILTLNESTISNNEDCGLDSRSNIVVTNSTISNNAGEGIYKEGIGILINSTVSNNINPYSFAGGILNYNGVLTLTNSIVSSNTSLGGGGGIDNMYATLTLNNSIVSNNTSLSSEGWGGGITNRYSTVVLNNSAISGNTSQYGSGGGIQNDYGSILILNNSTISANTGVYGGGIASLSGTVALNNTTISGNTNQNDAGGGLYNNGTVTVYESLFFNNSSDSGGGIYNNGGTVTVTTSEFSSNGASTSGGGIYNTGTLNITQSTFSTNNGYIGGGINNFGGSVVVDSTTFSNNSAMGGGGIYSSGGLGTANVTNSTFSNNHSFDQGGGISNSTPFTITNSTLYGNSSDGTGGGLFSSSAITLTFRNNILAGNTSVGTGPDCSGEITSQGYNLIQDTSGCTITGDTIGNLIGMDPDLGPLQDNGGATLTHALLTDSPAVDAGNPADPGSGGNACETADQRGVIRPQGVACDIGAFELEQPPAVEFSLSNYSINEDAGTATITVTLNTASALTATVDYFTSDGTATAGSDYTASPGTLTFAPGVTAQTFTVPITDDTLDEPDETLTVTLSNPVNAVLGTPDTAELTIVDNDEVVEFKVYLPLILK